MNKIRESNNEQMLFNLVQLLIDKGIITEQEYRKSCLNGVYFATGTEKKETKERISNQVKETNNKPLSKLDRLKQKKQTINDKPLSKLEQMKQKRLNKA
jgi:hypothetical protein